MNFNELKDKVLVTLKRSNDDELTNILDMYANFVEAEVNRRFNVAEMETVSRNTPDAGTTAYMFSWPGDYNGLRSIQILDLGGRSQNIELVSPENFNALYPQLCTGNQIGISGIPVRTKWVYCILDSSYKIAPPVTDSMTVEINYYAKIPPLGGILSEGGTRQTNWMLDGYPDIYYYGILKHCSPFIRNDTRTSLWENFYEKSLGGLEHHHNKVTWSGTTTRIRTRGAR